MTPRPFPPDVPPRAIAGRPQIFSIASRWRPRFAGTIALLLGAILFWATARTPVAIAGPQFPGSAAEVAELAANAANATSARDRFERAYNRRYTWDEAFPGYQAEVSVNESGQVDQGIVRLLPDLSVEVLNVEDSDLATEVRNLLRMEAIHRRPIPFDRLHDGQTFAFASAEDAIAFSAAEDASADAATRASESNDEKSDEIAAIVERGDRGAALYRLQGDRLVQVNRTLGDRVAVTVDAVGFTDSPEGYLTRHFKTKFFDPETGEILERDDVRDFHEKIGSYYLLTYRAVRRSPSEDPEEKPAPDAIFRFNDIQPLPEGDR